MVNTADIRLEKSVDYGKTLTPWRESKRYIERSRMSREEAAKSGVQNRRCASGWVRVGAGGKRFATYTKPRTTPIIAPALTALNRACCMVVVAVQPR